MTETRGELVFERVVKANRLSQLGCTFPDPELQTYIIHDSYKYKYLLHMGIYIKDMIRGNSSPTRSPPKRCIQTFKCSIQGVDGSVDQTPTALPPGPFSHRSTRPKSLPCHPRLRLP